MRGHDYDEGRSEAAFRREQLEKKRLRAIALAADPELTRGVIAKRLGVNPTTVCTWIREAGVRPGDGREKGLRSPFVPAGGPL